MFVPTTWFLPLKLSNCVAVISNPLPGNFVHIPGISDTWNCFSSKHFIIPSGIFLYCVDKQIFHKLLIFTSHFDTSCPPPLTFPVYLSHYLSVITSKLEQFFQMSMFYFSFSFRFCLLVAHVQQLASLISFCTILNRNKEFDVNT